MGGVNWVSGINSELNKIGQIEWNELNGVDGIQ